MRHFVRSAICNLAYGASFFKRRTGTVILMYHRINDVPRPSELVVPVVRFREQMEYLSTRYRVIGLEDLLCEQREPDPSDPRPEIVLSFDDGFRDTYANAFPIIKQFGFPAIVFLITGMIGTDKRLPRYRDMPVPDMMNWEEVKEMAESGVIFGCHSISHRRLTGMDYAGQEDEILDSLAVLKSHNLGAPAHRYSFCYPFGDYNTDTVRILKEAGIEIAVTDKPGVNIRGKNLLMLRRTKQKT